MYESEWSESQITYISLESTIDVQTRALRNILTYESRTRTVPELLWASCGVLEEGLSGGALSSP